MPGYCLAPWLRVGVVTLLLAVAATPARSAAATDTCAKAARADSAAATAQRLLDALVATSGVPGMGAAVYRDGRIVWTGCAGWRDIAAREPVRADTVFRLASISKIVTTTAIARLAERGELDLDAPVSDLLPWLPKDWPALSLRQLAAHVGGIAHYSDEDADRGRVHYATAREAVARFAGRPLIAPPGTAYHYSSWGYTLIGAVIEARTQQPFLDHLRKHVTRGLDIRPDSDGRGEDVSRLYVIGHGAPRLPPPHDYSYTWPGGGLAATPATTARFGARVMDGSLISVASWAAMRVPVLLTSGAPAGERDYAVGLGWRVGSDADGARIVHHSGATEGSRGSLVLWPEERTVVSLLSNASWTSAIDQSAMQLAAPFRIAPARSKSACPLQAKRYEGRLGDEPVAGEVVFRMERKRCIGELSPDAPLQRHFAPATAWPNQRLTLIALDADGGLMRVALVTPFGIYAAKPGDEGRWSVALNPDTTLQIAWSAPAE